MAQTERLPFRGGLTCLCVATSLPIVEAEMLQLGLIKRSVDVFQLGYNAGGVAASAGTHDGGGATDVGQFSPAHLAIWRKYGWTTQHRTRAQGFAADHGHGFPYGCPHLSAGARFQASEWAAGRNGLRSRGYVSGPGFQVVTWKAALARIPATTLSALTPGDDLSMATWKTFSTAKTQALPVKDYAYLRVNDAGDVSVATGPAKILGGYLNLRLEGLPAGRSAWVRFVWDDVDGTKTTRAKTGILTEVPGSSGSSSATIPLAMNVPKAPAGARRVRVIIATPIPGVTVTRAEVSYWKV